MRASSLTAHSSARQSALQAETDHCLHTLYSDDQEASWSRIGMGRDQGTLFHFLHLLSHGHQRKHSSERSVLINGSSQLKGRGGLLCPSPHFLHRHPVKL
ncbi:hypothetical protein FKM82_025304 [Ascaphus truei]